MYEFTQHALMDAIIDDVSIGNAYTKPVLATVPLLLHAFCDSPKFDGTFNYRSAVGKLNCPGQTIRLDKLYAVHPVAKYSANTKLNKEWQQHHITLDFTSSQIYPKASNATETLTLLEVRTRNLQQLILAWLSLGVAGSHSTHTAHYLGF
ncbi:hypothetical protein ACHAW6_012646 [Cyclotella cf. meneghiniana]